MTATVAATPSYNFRPRPSGKDFTGAWSDPFWAAAQTGRIAHFHARSSVHRPATEFRGVYDEAAVYVAFRVMDRFVRCRRTRTHDSVCKDSCVEFFVRPIPGKGYFNFEINCCGTLLAYYVEDWKREGDGLRRYTPLTPVEIRALTVTAALPPVVWPEVEEPLVWTVAARIPLQVLTGYVGELPATPSQRRWRANFYKCADESSHPHWGSWAPINGQLNFHRPECFGRIVFAD